MSEGIHLPPSAHGTFEADGFVICTFAPRPLEAITSAARAVVPRNIDYDEVFFVHSGEFTLSRRSGTTPYGVLSLIRKDFTTVHNPACGKQRQELAERRSLGIRRDQSRH